MAKEEVAVARKRHPINALHFTRHELKEFIERFEIFAIEEITEVFAGLPCRTVKLYPIPYDCKPQTIEELFSDGPGRVVAILTLPVGREKKMYVNFSTIEAYQFALEQATASLDQWPFKAEVLPDTEFLNVLRELVLELGLYLPGEYRRSSEQPASTCLSKDLDIFLSVLRSTVQDEKRKVEEEGKAKLAPVECSEQPEEEEYVCPRHKKLNKFEIAYAAKVVKPFDIADHLPASIVPRMRRLQRERREATRMRAVRKLCLAWVVGGAAAVAVGYYALRVVRRLDVISQPSSLVV